MKVVVAAVFICFVAGKVSAQLCPGVCDTGDTLVNPIFAATIDGDTKPCNAWSGEFQNLPTDQCSEKQTAARDAGCKCGIPIVCEGICDTSGGQVLYNPVELVTIGEDTQVCASFDTLIKSIQLQDECDDASQAALDAGCRCGEPVPCLGICPGSQLSNPGDAVMIGTETNTCFSFDSQAIEKIVDPDGCTDFRASAMEAGCMCVATSPTDAPTGTPTTPVPTDAPISEATSPPSATLTTGPSTSPSNTPTTPVPTDAPISDATSPPSATLTTGPSISPSNTPTTPVPTDAPIIDVTAAPATDAPTSSGILFSPVPAMTSTAAATLVLWTMTWLF